MLLLLSIILAMVFFVFICFGIGALIGIPIAGFTFYGQVWAKREAKQILAINRITDYKKFEKVSGILAKVTNDLEATDLWHKLQNLKEQQYKVRITEV